MAAIGKDINIAKQLLEEGQLVAVPTETVYGLAGNALNAQAIAKIFSVKGRPEFDPLIVHVANIDQISLYAKNIPK
jgi:L-threonylcarbamoyladenylate synthase